MRTKLDDRLRAARKRWSSLPLATRLLWLAVVLVAAGLLVHLAQ